MLVRDQYDDGGISGGTLERPGLKRLLADVEDGLVDVVVVYKIDRLSRSLMDFSEAGRGVRPERRDLRLGHAVLQHHHLHGAADAEHPAQLRPVRARGDGRAHPRQGPRQPDEGHVDGRMPAVRLRGERPQAGHQRGRCRACPLDLRALPRDRLGNGTGAGTGEAGRPDQPRQPDRQEVPLSAAEQPRPHRRGGAQGRPAIPASTTRSSTARRGTRSMPSCRKARASAPRAPAPTRPRC